MNHLKRRFHLLVHSALQHAASREMLEGILRFAAVHPEWEIQIEGGHPSGRSIEVYPEWKPDALITNERSLKYSRKDFCKIAGRAVVYVNTRPRRDVGIPYATISSEDRVLAESAAAFFLRKQMASFAFVGSPGGERWSEARRRLFQAALREKSYPLHTFNPPQSRSWEKQEKALVAWLAKLPKPCGVWAAYDHRARQVLDACRCADIEVPEQIQILGVDNEAYVCEHTLPSLSSIAPDYESAGYEAFSFVDQVVRLGHAAEASPRLKIPIKGIVERNSTSDDNASTRRVAAARAFIRKYATAQISVADVASSVAVSKRLLEHVFRLVTGHTLLEEIQAQRLTHACELLNKTSTKIDSIAGMCGFSSPSYLKALFKRQFGMTMGDFRRRGLQK